MAKKSRVLTSMWNVRVIGSEYQGVRYPAVYFAPGTKNGRFLPARIEFNVMENQPDWTDANGNKVEGRKNTYRLVAWDSKNAPSGKGIASVLAKCLTVGKSLNLINVQGQSFLKTVYNGDQIVLKADGTPLQHVANTYRIQSFDNFDLGDDSKKCIAVEIQNYQGVPAFGARPAGWNIDGHADQQKWLEQELPARMATAFAPGMEVFGYARVIVADGLVVGNQNVTAVPQAGATPTEASATLAQPQPQPVQPTGAVNPVNTASAGAGAPPAGL